MRRTPFPAHVIPLRRVTPLRDSGRVTGPDRATRLAVLERDSWRCVACGIPVRGRPHSLQHRLARRMGGTRGPVTNSPVNLILLCGSATSPGGCHLRCEQRDPAMHAAGCWLESWQNPAAEPVLVAGYGSGALVWLTPDGAYSTVPPGGGAA